MACSSSLKRWTLTTGPKTSSWTISLRWSGPGDDRRLVVGAGAVGPLAAGDDLGAGPGTIDHALDLVGLGAGDQRAHLDVVALGRVAPLDGLDRIGQVGHEPVVDLRAGDDPAGSRAILTGIPEAEGLEVLDDGFHVGVVEDDHRRLAAELEVDALDAIGGDLGDVLAGVGVAGDRDHPDLRMADERVADRGAGAGDDVEDAGRQDVGGDLGEDERPSAASGPTA